MSSKIVLPLVLLFVAFFTSIPLYGWPMERGEKQSSDTSASAEGKEKLRNATAGIGTEENSSAAVARGDGSRLSQEQVREQEPVGADQKGVEQPLDFSKMRDMQLVNRATMTRWVEAEVAGEIRAFSKKL